MSVNKTILIGRVGKDPEVKTINDNKVAKFSLVTSEKYTNKQGEKIENSEWHNLTVWGKLAEIIEKYVKKGDLLYVEGKIHYGDYTDKDNVKKYFTEIRVDAIRMLGSNNAKPEAAPVKSSVLGSTEAPDGFIAGTPPDVVLDYHPGSPF